jgi:hypothetical protein
MSLLSENSKSVLNATVAVTATEVISESVTTGTSVAADLVVSNTSSLAGVILESVDAGDADVTLEASDSGTVVYFDTALTAPRTVTLPSTSPTGTIFSVFNLQNSGQVITISAGTNTINGASQTFGGVLTSVAGSTKLSTAVLNGCVRLRAVAVGTATVWLIEGVSVEFA